MGMTLRLLGLILATSVTLAAAPRKFSSGPAQTHLIELFTSEGCSSCPPAEKWFGDLRAAPGLWRDFVPVAFPVDYWDRLGWKDRFARREFTDRQYHYGSVWGVTTVYTPGFVLDGKDWRERLGRKLPLPGEKTGTLTVEIAGGRCVVNYAPTAVADEAYEAHVALLGGGIVTQVKAGENRGETLEHEFVALALTRHTLAQGRAEFALPSSAAPGVARQALAVWVTPRGSSEPLQATGGWLD
jgi:hypothetical protein